MMMTDDGDGDDDDDDDDNDDDHIDPIKAGRQAVGSSQKALQCQVVQLQI